MNRRDALLALLALGVGPHTAWGQHAAAVHRIAFLSNLTASSLTSRVGALRSGLKDLGYVEGKNIVIEYR